MVVPHMDQNAPSLFLSIRALIDCHIDLDKFNHLDSIVYLSFEHDCVEHVIVIRNVIFNSNHDHQNFFACSKLVILT